MFPTVYRLVDRFGEPIRGSNGLVTVINNVSYINNVPVDQATLDAIQGNDVIPSASIEGHWYDPVTGEDLGTIADQMRKRAAYLAGQQYTFLDRVAEAGTIAVIAWAGGGAFAGGAAAEASTGLEAGTALEAGTGIEAGTAVETTSLGTTSLEVGASNTLVIPETSAQAISGGSAATAGSAATVAAPAALPGTSFSTSTTLADLLPESVSNILPASVSNASVESVLSGVAEKIYQGTGRLSGAQPPHNSNTARSSTPSVLDKASAIAGVSPLFLLVAAFLLIFGIFVVRR